MKTPSSAALVAILTLLGAASASALPPSAANDVGPIVVQMNLVNADGGEQPVGTITARDSGYGLILTADLKGLPPGLHGFHLHQNPSCAPGEKDGKKGAALGAGGHYDPATTGRHEGPYGTGHLGDLPAIYVAPDGSATYPVLAPRLKTADLPGHALMIHAGGDNNSDTPAPLGGGGPRIACGIASAPAKR